MIVQQCYSREQLENFVLGRLPEELAEQISEHIESCQACGTGVASCDQADDSLLRGLRAGGAALPPPHCLSGEAEPSVEHACRAALDRVISLGSRPQFDDALQSLVNGDTSEALIRDYRLTERLGQGGMGAVYRAVHIRLGREVAVKLLPQQRLRDLQAVSRFQREMKAIGQLDHPSIVRATDAGEVEGTHFLVMELVDGVDLSELSRACGPLPAGAACELVCQAAQGLDHAHRLGMVHRDVKPSNLMLTAEGQLKILDLGLALLGQQGAVDDLTTVGQLMGTLDYMAPEQCDNCHDVDALADVYSLGATLYKLLAGRAPYGDSKGPLRKLKKMATDRPTPLAELREDLPEPLCAIVQAALSRDPQQRPATAAELCQQLAPWRDPSELPRLCDEARRQRGKLPPQRSPVSTPPQPTAAQRRSAPRWPWFVAAAVLGAAMIWLAITLTLQLDRGQLVVESEVDQIEVRLLKDGKDIQMQVEQGENEITIRSGNYELKLSTPSDGVTIQPREVSIRRGEKTIVRVTRKEPGVNEPAPATAAADDERTSKNAVLAARNLLLDGAQFEHKNLGSWLEWALDNDPLAELCMTAVTSIRDTYPAATRRQAADLLLQSLKTERSPNQTTKIGAMVELLLGDQLTEQDVKQIFTPIGNASPAAIAASFRTVTPRASRGSRSRPRFDGLDLKIGGMLHLLPASLRKATVTEFLADGSSVLRKGCFAYFENYLQETIRLNDSVDAANYFRSLTEAAIKATHDELDFIRLASVELLAEHGTHSDATRERAIELLEDKSLKIAGKAAMLLANHWPKTEGLDRFLMQHVDSDDISAIKLLRLVAPHQPQLRQLILERLEAIKPPGKPGTWDGELLAIFVSLKPPATKELRVTLEFFSQQEIEGSPELRAMAGMLGSAGGGSMAMMGSSDALRGPASLAIAADTALQALFGKPIPLRYSGRTCQQWLDYLFKHKAEGPRSSRRFFSTAVNGIRKTMGPGTHQLVAERLIRQSPDQFAREVLSDIPPAPLKEALQAIWADPEVSSDVLVFSIDLLSRSREASAAAPELWPALLRFVDTRSDDRVFGAAASLAAALARRQAPGSDVRELAQRLFQLMSEPRLESVCAERLAGLAAERYVDVNAMIATGNPQLLFHLLQVKTTTEEQVLRILDSFDAVPIGDGQLQLVVTAIERIAAMKQPSNAAMSRLRKLASDPHEVVRTSAEAALRSLRPDPKRYDDKDMDEWIALLNVELKQAARLNAIDAIGRLSAYDDRQADAFAALLAADAGADSSGATRNLSVLQKLASTCSDIPAAGAAAMLDKAIVASDPPPPLPFAILSFNRRALGHREQGDQTPLGSALHQQPEAFQQLQARQLKMCRHRQAYVRRWALDSLADPLAPEAIQLMIESLDDRSPQLVLTSAQRLLEQTPPPKALVSWFGKTLAAFAEGRASGPRAQPTVGRGGGRVVPFGDAIYPSQHWCMLHANELGKAAEPLLPTLKRILDVPAKPLITVSSSAFRGDSDLQLPYNPGTSSVSAARRAIQAIGSKEAEAVLEQNE